jgi:hypothetical protein
LISREFLDKGRKDLQYSAPATASVAGSDSLASSRDDLADDAARIPMTRTDTAHRCDECGARYEAAGDSCQARFDALLALDHSRREPWGSRHGLAFAAFAVQHPRRFPAASIAASRVLLERVCHRHEPLAAVVKDFRARSQAPTDSTVPEAIPPFAVTIADLGAFDAATYPDDLMRWARAAIAAHSEGEA